MRTEIGTECNLHEQAVRFSLQQVHKGLCSLVWLRSAVGDHLATARSFNSLIDIRHVLAVFFIILVVAAALV